MGSSYLTELTMLRLILFAPAAFSAVLNKKPDNDDSVIDKRSGDDLAAVDHVICPDGSKPKPTEISGWFSCQPNYFQKREFGAQKPGSNYLSMPWAIFKRSQDHQSQPATLSSKQHSAPIFMKRAPSDGHSGGEEWYPHEFNQYFKRSGHYQPIIKTPRSAAKSHFSSDNNKVPY